LVAAIPLKLHQFPYTFCVADRIFDRFYRVNDAAINTFPGLGLGLYLASQIIKKQNGKIWMKSKLGKGSTFFFSLPRQNGLPGAAAGG